MDRLIDGWTTLVHVWAENSAPAPQLPKKVWESRLRIFFFLFSLLIFKFKHLRAVEVLATQPVLSLAFCRRRFLDAAFPRTTGSASFYFWQRQSICPITSTSCIRDLEWEGVIIRHYLRALKPSAFSRVATYVCVHASTDSSCGETIWGINS